MVLEPELYTEQIALGGRKFLLERVRNVNEMIDEAVDDPDNTDGRLPYWAELWPSAYALTEYVVENGSLFEGKRVLELGCGLGLTTVALAQARPSSLLSTDYEEKALERTRQNLRLNRAAPWPRLRLLDWRCIDIEERFDIIIGSDIVYEKKVFEPLQEVFDQLLAADGSIIVAEPNRMAAKKFFQLLESTGYRISSLEKTVQWEEHETDVTIRTLTPSPEC